MARPPFNVTIKAICRVSRPDGTPLSTNVVNGYVANETCTGVGGHINKTGWMPPKAYRMFYESRRYAVGRCEYQSNINNLAFGQVYEGCVGPSSGGRFNGDSHWNSAVLDSNIEDESVRQRALLKARLKMKQASVNLGVAFAERNATARLLGDTASRLGRSFNKLKRGQVRAAMRELGLSSRNREPRGSNVPNKWLELQYGWKPLLSDVYGACDALSRRNQSDWRVTAVASDFAASQYYASFTGPDAGFVEVRVENGAFVRIDALPENDLTMSLRSLGITNPLLIAWELVPYSFVVDWMLPVGTWLESIDAMLGYSKASTSSSLFTRGEWRDRGRNESPTPTSRVKNSYEGTKKVVILDRDASNGVPMPTFPRIKKSGKPRSHG
jgi:hypothetical protein